MTDRDYMRLALRLARRGLGATSPNPMVGAVLVKGGKILGRGWHRRAGQPHAEIEAMQDAARRGHNPRGSTIYVTLEPCCTHGRTPPCTEALIRAGIKRAVIGATDPNPDHCGKGFAILKQAGIEVCPGVLAEDCERLNEAFNYWIVHRTPLVTVKAAMTLDGKIATPSGDLKWITSEQARAYGMRLRGGSDAILVGINTILADDPSLTFRHGGKTKAAAAAQGQPRLRRIVLDAHARTPPHARVARDPAASLTTIFVGRRAPVARVRSLEKRVRVVRAPAQDGKINLPWILRYLGKEGTTSLLVEGGGEVNASFLMQGLAQKIAFFYAPKILGGRDARRAVAGDGVTRLADALNLCDVCWRRLGPDLLLSARVRSPD